MMNKDVLMGHLRNIQTRKVYILQQAHYYTNGITLKTYIELMNLVNCLESKVIKIQFVRASKTYKIFMTIHEIRTAHAIICTAQPIITNYDNMRSIHSQMFNLLYDLIGNIYKVNNWVIEQTDKTISK